MGQTYLRAAQKKIPIGGYFEGLFSYTAVVCRLIPMAKIDLFLAIPYVGFCRDGIIGGS